MQTCEAEVCPCPGSVFHDLFWTDVLCRKICVHLPISARQETLHLPTHLKCGRVHVLDFRGFGAHSGQKLSQ